MVNIRHVFGSPVAGCRVRRAPRLHVGLTVPREAGGWGEHAIDQ